MRRAITISAVQSTGISTQFIILYKIHAPDIWLGFSPAILPPCNQAGSCKRAKSRSSLPNLLHTVECGRLDMLEVHQNNPDKSAHFCELGSLSVFFEAAPISIGTVSSLTSCLLRGLTPLWEDSTSSFSTRVSSSARAWFIYLFGRLFVMFSFDSKF